jgi:TolB protein
VTSLRDGTVTPLGVNGVRALAVRDGKIHYARADGVLMSVPFDVEARKVTGAPQPIPDAPVVRFNQNGNTRIAVGRSGGILTLERHFRALLGWARGNDTPTLISRESREYWQPPRLSPDGSRIVTEIGDVTSSQIWVTSIASGAMTRLTSGQWSGNPVWSPDSRSITYLSADGDSLQIVRQPADGGRSPQSLAMLEFHSLLPFATPDGSAAVYRAERSGNNDIRVISLRDGMKARSRPLIATQANEWAADFSPNGRWLPVRSDESGRYELSLRSFPDPSIRLSVSSDGISDRPFWSRDGRVLYYPNAAGALIALHLSGDSTLTVTSREVVRAAPRPRAAETTDAEAIQPRAPDVRFYPSDIASDGRLLGRVNSVVQSRLVIEPTWRP